MTTQRRARPAEDGIDRLIARLAERQHGVVARAQLRAAGIGHHAIDGRRRRGQLHLLYRGVYAVGHRKLTKEGQWLAAVLAAGPDAVLSHRSAGQLWGLIPRSTAIAEVTRPRTFRERDGFRCHHGRVPLEEIESVEGIPATSASRTLLDLASILDRPRLELALNELEVRRLTSRVSLPELLRRHPRRRGVARLRALLDEDAGSRGVTRRELEARFAAFVEEYDLPRPLRNVDVAAGGRFYEADCAWPDRRLIVELDGRGAHDTRLAYESDRRRDRHLTGAGWRVVRITWRQLHDETDAIATELREALRVQRSH